MSNPWRKDWPFLTFDPLAHIYSVGRWGQVVPSVTQVLSKAGLGFSFDSEALRNGMERGRAVHLAAQYLDEGCLNRESVDPAIRGFLAGYEKFKAAANPEILLIEQPFYHGDLDFAGTIDRVVRIGSVAGPLDIKTGSVPATTPAQLAAYEQGLDYALGADLFLDIKNKMHGLGRARWSLLLRANGTFMLSRTYGGLDIWMAALTVVKFKEAKHG